ncbi:MAG TPA: PD-(D/E)XK nuclease family protein, partial [Nitrosopumilaceae archaeon]|nr:PD-(D/E)XK nuclease family protein [Nitrosopumilaceae archaeon]
KLPAVFGAKPLINPIPEQYIKVDVNDWLILSGKIDCYDKPTIYEWKTGRANSEEIARTKQPAVYAVLATLNGMYADRAEIHCFNQHLANDNKSMSIVKITDQVLEEGLNWIVTIAGDMRNYIEQNKLFDKYSQKL